MAAAFVLSGFWVRLISFTFMFAVLAWALNIIAGFGNMVFFGVGAYTTAVLMNEVGLPFHVALAASAGMAVLISILLGLLLLRLKGHYFAPGALSAPPRR